MIDIEAHRSNEYAPQKAAIAGLPEQIGLTKDSVETAILQTSSYEEALAFVQGYVDHVQDTIDLNHKKDAEALAKRHLMDYLFFVQAPVEMKEGHPIALDAEAAREASERFIVSAMMEVFKDNFPGGFNEKIPTNQKYVEIKNSILAARRATLSA